jgi:hypothetical protein
LSHHLDPLIREFAAFTAKADAALANEQALLKGSALDLALLPKIAVHDVFLAGKRPKTLGDYVHASKMEQVRDACRLTHGLFRFIVPIACQLMAIRRSYKTIRTAESYDRSTRHRR